MSELTNAAKLPSKKKNMPKIDIRTFTMIGGLVLLWILFTYTTDGTFLLVRNISNLLRQMAIVGILGAGMVLVIVTGNIDLSVGSVLGFLGGLAAALMIWNGWGTPATMAVILLAGALIGVIQGSIIAYIKVPAFIVTLGGLLIFRGGLLGVTKGVSIAPFRPSYIYVGQAYVSNEVGVALGVLAVVVWTATLFNKRRSRLKYNFPVESLYKMAAKIAVAALVIMGIILMLNSYNGIPVPVLLMVVLMVIFTFVAEKTTFGRSIYAMGGNMEASKYSGIDVRKNLVIVYMLNGVLAAIAGIVLSARLNAGTPSAGMNMELDAIAAAVIGGASMSGGSGKVAGAALGALFMATIDNGMSMMNMDAYWQYIVKGFILVIAVGFDIYTKNKR
ncbi:sugar ABC transporter permease [Anaerotalea alkaliphila]|uniref:Xylose transport system permease protein XylH n=1 Tax=Anaerotalea alkaliphila TaxID=2662126 RepID=A0A7X5KN78_9FIRM|nr:sugar ABC transporter permease [Anaerotalea alkaliphila]NDL67503.1 sugar ABC transporter permease [Anaerotalea alkaliphila]